MTLLLNRMNLMILLIKVNLKMRENQTLIISLKIVANLIKLNIKKSDTDDFYKSSSSDDS